MSPNCPTDTTKVAVAIVIINYNSAEYTLQCLNSIFEKTRLNEYSVIVVDNNSKPEDVKNLENGLSKFTNVVLIKSKINLGFSGGNMLGAQFANAKYVFFLNNDTILLNDCLSIMNEFLERNPQVGLCTGQMYNPDMSQHHSFGYFPTLKLRLLGSWLLRLFNPKSYPPKKLKYIQPLSVQLVTGAAMFVRYSAFAHIGGFDTNFFLYCEEEDVAYRMKKNNFECFVVPDARFIHFAGKSTQRNLSVEKEYYISLLYYLRKHTNALSYPFHVLFYFFKNVKKAYKGLHFIKLGLFILRGAPMKYSLKHKQKLSLPA